MKPIEQVLEWSPRTNTTPSGDVNPLHLSALHPTCQAYPWDMGGSRCSTLSRGCGQLFSSFQAWDEVLNPRLDFIRH
jgi:hypothetical protein